MGASLAYATTSEGRRAGAIDPRALAVGRAASAAAVALLLLALPPAAWPHGLADRPIAFDVEHTVVTTGADGVVRTSRFTDRIVRDAGNVWQQRLVPLAAAARAHAAERGNRHRHLDTVTGGRWMVRDGDGPPRFSIVDLEDRVVVEIDRTEYRDVGTDGRWDTAFHLVDPAMLGAMTRRGSPAADGSQWYERRDEAGLVRVRWDPRLTVPLEVSSRSADGLAERRTMVRPVPLPARMPWRQAAGWPRRAYADYMD